MKTSVWKKVCRDFRNPLASLACACESKETMSVLVMNIIYEVGSWTYTGVVFDGCIVLIVNIVVCGRIVAATEQSMRLVMYEGRKK